MNIVESKGAFHTSKLVGRIMAEHILTMKNALSKYFVEKPSPSCIPFKIWQIPDWKVIISEFLITTGMVWPVSSDKWKAPWQFRGARIENGSLYNRFMALTTPKGSYTTWVQAPGGFNHAGQILKGQTNCKAWHLQFGGERFRHVPSPQKHHYWNNIHFSR